MCHETHVAHWESKWVLLLVRPVQEGARWIQRFEANAQFRINELNNGSSRWLIRANRSYKRLSKWKLFFSLRFWASLAPDCSTKLQLQQQQSRCQQQQQQQQQLETQTVAAQLTGRARVFNSELEFFLSKLFSDLFLDFHLTRFNFILK